MKTVFNKSMIVMMMAAGLFTSCINDDDYDTPEVVCAETYITPNIQPKEVPAEEEAKQYLPQPGGKIIEAYVVSTDVEGNYFKSISMQTRDGSFGFSVPVDIIDVFTKLEPGRKVFIKLDSLYTDLEFGSLRIGAYYNENPKAVGRMSPAEVKAKIIPSCQSVPQDSLVRKMSISEAMQDKNLNTLIELTDVEFVKEAVYKTYYDSDNELGGATNYFLEDKNDSRVIFRTSEFAAYATSKVPAESGNIRGIMGRYQDDYQFIPRVEADIKLTQPRFGEAPPNPNESQSASGGTEVTYTGNFTEDFQSYSVGATSFPKYINDYTVGDRYWQIKEYQGNRHIEMTSFSGASNPGEAAKSFFFVPVDFSLANSFTFKKEIRFMKGEALKVYYITEANYQPRMLIDTTKLVNITDQFNNLIYPGMDQSQTTFSTAGTYTLPASLTGNGFFVFEYTGSSTVTTTIQIDDIVIN